MTDLSASEVKRKRVVYLILSTVSLLFLGLIYGFSMFAKPMTVAFCLEGQNVGLTFNIMMICFCVGAVICSFVDKAAGIKPCLFLAGILFLVGFGGTALFAHDNIVAVYLLYGVCAGLGSGFGYNVVVATTNVWFPDKVGFSSGVLMLGFGVSSLLLGTLSVNLYQGGMSLETIFIAIGVLTCIVAFALAFVLKKAPQNIVQLMVPDAPKEQGEDEDKGEICLTSPTFYVYWIWAIIVIAIGLATIGNCSSDAQICGIDAGFATLLVGLVSTCNGLSRVVIGAIYDRTNVKVTMLADGVIALAAVAFVIGGFMLSMPVLYIVGALLCGFCYGGVPVVASAFARQRFGKKNYPTNLSLANFAIVFGSLLNIAVGTATGGVRLSVFMVMLVLSILAVVDVLPFTKMLESDLAKRK